MIEVVGVLALIYFLVLFAVLLVSKTKVFMVLLAYVATMSLGWGTLTHKLNDRLRMEICPERKNICINLDDIYASPAKYADYHQTEFMLDINREWGWLIWSGYFLLAYFLALVWLKFRGRSSKP